MNGGGVVFGADAGAAGGDSSARRGTSVSDARTSPDQSAPGNGAGGGPGIVDAARAMDSGAVAIDAPSAVDASVGPPPCAGCRVSVRYMCADLMPVQAQRGFTLRLVNPTSELIPLTSVKLRYWFSTAALPRQVFECDFASVHSLQGTCADIVPTSSFSMVAPPRMNANAYFEIGFGPRAGALEALHDDASDRIMMRLHDVEFTAIDQRADYSYNCTMPGREIESPRITAYINGALVFGREPP